MNINYVKKSKVNFECCASKAQLNVDYFVIQLYGKASCLLCNDTSAVLKEYNLFSHYQTKHSSQYPQLTEKQQ